MCRAKEITNELIKYVNEIKQTYEKNKARISNLELEDNDFKHEIRDANLNAIQLMQVVTKYRKILRERKKLKNENATLIYLYDMFEKMPDFETRLQKAMSNIDKTLNIISEKKYVPKARTDLTIGKPLDFKDLKKKMESRNVS